MLEARVPRTGRTAHLPGRRSSTDGGETGAHGSLDARSTPLAPRRRAPVDQRGRHVAAQHGPLARAVLLPPRDLLATHARADPRARGGDRGLADGGPPPRRRSPEAPRPAR